MGELLKFPDNQSQEPAMSDEPEKPELGDGYMRVVNALAEGLASHPITSIQNRVIWAVMRLTYGWQKGKDRIAASQLAEITGLRRQQCSAALNELIEAGVIIREGGSRSPIKINTKVSEWSFKEKRTKDNISGRVNTNHDSCSVNTNCGHSVTTNSVHTKDKRQSNTPSEYSSSPEGNDQDQAETKSSGTKPPCPYEQIRDLYHEILPELPECKILNETRKSCIKARWNSVAGRTPCASIDFWRRYFNFVRKSAFLMGQSDPAPGRKVFRADLEWLVKSGNFAKIIEGRYHEEGEK